MENINEETENGYRLRTLTGVGGDEADNFLAHHNIDINKAQQAISSGAINKYELRDVIQGKAPRSISNKVLKHINEKSVKEEEGMVSTDDEKKAADLAKQGVNVKLTSESVQSTRSVAKKAGAAILKAFSTIGEDISDAKAMDILDNSFSINVIYSNDNEEKFSFFIGEDDTLYLKDLSSDKPLVDVDIKPSGEVTLHVDHLASELVKHFNSLNETFNKYKASSLLKEMKKTNTNELANRIVVPSGQAVKALGVLNDRIKGHFSPLGPDAFVFGDDRAKKAAEIILTKAGIQVESANSLKTEAPTGMSYITVSVIDARKAMDMMDDAYRGDFEMNGSNVYYFGDSGTAYDAMMDLEAADIEIEDYHIDGFENDLEEDHDIGHQDNEPDMLKQHAYDIATYAAKLYKSLNQYSGQGEVDFPNWWQEKVILARDYISKAQHYLEFEEKQPALDQLALEEVVNDPRIGDSKFGPSPAKFAKLRKQMGDEALLDKIQMLNANVLMDVLDELEVHEGAPVNEGASTEEKRIAMLAMKKIAKYRNVDIKVAADDLCRAAEELRRQL